MTSAEAHEAGIESSTDWPLLIPREDILPTSPPGPVAPAIGQPGGGVEIKAPLPVPNENAVSVKLPGGGGE
jgi:hypothetical protein